MFRIPLFLDLSIPNTFKYLICVLSHLLPGVGPSNLCCFGLPQFVPFRSVQRHLSSCCINVLQETVIYCNKASNRIVSK